MRISACLPLFPLNKRIAVRKIRQRVSDGLKRRHPVRRQGTRFQLADLQISPPKRADASTLAVVQPSKLTCRASNPYYPMMSRSVTSSTRPLV
jgi:hypothetical protein